ncbi:hypothetical protein ABN702_00530 [Bacillus haimaensis]|uniref:hypothetical protein n=1 Tax=Bacillus haimaensis TaxID=3160967 RepID=UPI003AA9CD85
MRKYVILVLSLVMICLPLYGLYYESQPKVGPIGNGVQNTPGFLVVWPIIAGLCFLTLSIIMFVQERKTH